MKSFCAFVAIAVAVAVAGSVSAASQPLPILLLATPGAHGLQARAAGGNPEHPSLVLLGSKDGMRPLTARDVAEAGGSVDDMLAVARRHHRLKGSSSSWASHLAQGGRYKLPVLLERAEAEEKEDGPGSKAPQPKPDVGVGTHRPFLGGHVFGHHQHRPEPSILLIPLGEMAPQSIHGGAGTRLGGVGGAASTKSGLDVTESKEPVKGGNAATGPAHPLP